MPPVTIFRFSPTEGPAYFAEWLAQRGLAHELVAIDAGAPVPGDPRAYAGIAMMGGPMSVNDALPWIAPLSRLLRDAVDARVPILGHCLGGQLLARALDAPVTRAAVPEIGWVDVDCEGEGAAEWFGARSRFTAFQWHYETFAVPAEATRVLTNAFTPNQAFIVDDRHIGLQCHVEMTSDLIDTWCRVGAHELPGTSSPNVQSAGDIAAAAPQRLPELHRVATSLYERWAQGLQH